MSSSSLSSTSDTALRSAIAAMNSGTQVFDVTIVCTTDDYQATYWMDKLSNGLLRKQCPETDVYPLVLAVSEDWCHSSGAGNGLGTLYAIQKAAQLAAAATKMSETGGGGIDLLAELAAGTISAALYHTAGKGTRLAPLPASENNNKPGVKLPFPLQVASKAIDNGNHSTGDSSCITPLTVLESVVKQTGIYAATRKGRVSVFWGDQVFIPSVGFSSPPTHHVDILCTLIGGGGGGEEEGDPAACPSAEEWTARGLDKYGVIAVLDHGEAAQVEKVSHATATQMLQSLGSIQQVGPSLGSFSVSAHFLMALLQEFAAELSAKTDKLDTDPHFWMPLTLGQESYVTLMTQKDTPVEESTRHYQRMAAFKSKFLLELNAEKDTRPYLGLFGAVNVGKDACWWDYGQLKLYSQNSLLLLEPDHNMNAHLLRQFLGVSSHSMHSSTGHARVDDGSYLFGTRIRQGSVVASILNAVTAESIHAEGAIVVNCCAKKIVAEPGAILYNLVDESEHGIVALAGQVIVAVTNEQGQSVRLQSHTDIDGGKAWKTVLEMNDLSFEQVHSSNKNANIRVIDRLRQEHYNKVAASLEL